MVTVTFASNALFQGLLALEIISCIQQLIGPSRLRYLAGDRREIFYGIEIGKREDRYLPTMLLKS